MRRIAAWQQSGLTKVAFAEREGFNAHTFSYWKCVLGKEEREGGRTAARKRKRGPRRSTSVAAADFVEVRGPASAQHPGDSSFALEFGDGRVVRIPAGFQPDALRQLLDVVGGAQ